MDTKKLRQKILDLAIHGKLVPPACRQAGKTLTTNPTPRKEGAKAWFTYVIECEDGSFYKGFTDNLLRRYQQHCAGSGAEYTRAHHPKQLFYWEMHYTQKEAIERERYLKSGSGREWFKREVVEKPENWEPASVLLQRIREEKEHLIKEGKIKHSKKTKTSSDTPPYGNNVPFEVPEGWVWCKIEDVAYDLLYGTSEKSSSVGQVAVLRMGNINRQGSIDYSNLVYTSNEEDIQKYELIPGDLLFNSLNSAAHNLVKRLSV